MIELFLLRGAFSVQKKIRGVSQRDEEFKARSQVEDWGKLDLEGLLSKLAAKSQCSQPVQARAQASGGSCSSGSCSSGDALVGCATTGSGTIVARAERMAQRRHLRARKRGNFLCQLFPSKPLPLPVTRSRRDAWRTSRNS
jgi:predicted alpha/beta hydrolase